MPHYHCETSFDLIDPFKASWGTPEVHRSQFDKHWHGQVLEECIRNW